MHHKLYLSFVKCGQACRSTTLVEVSSPASGVSELGRCLALIVIRECQVGGRAICAAIGRGAIADSMRTDLIRANTQDMAQAKIEQAGVHGRRQASDLLTSRVRVLYRQPIVQACMIDKVRTPEGAGIMSTSGSRLAR